MINWLNKKRNQKGFTLVELVVVVAILGILAAVAIPRFGAFRTTATEGADDASIETIESAIKLGFASKNVEAGTYTWTNISEATADANGSGAAWIKAHLDEDTTMQYYTEVSFVLSPNGDVAATETAPTE